MAFKLIKNQKSKNFMTSSTNIMAHISSAKNTYSTSSSMEVYMKRTTSGRDRVEQARLKTMLDSSVVEIDKLKEELSKEKLKGVKLKEE